MVQKADLLSNNSVRLNGSISCKLSIYKQLRYTFSISSEFFINEFRRTGCSIALIESWIERKWMTANITASFMTINEYLIYRFRTPYKPIVEQTLKKCQLFANT